MKLTILILVSVFFASCSATADNKVPELANEMCGCFTEFQQSLSPEGKDLMKAVSIAANPQTELMTGMSKIKTEDAVSFAEKIKSIGTKGSQVYNCMEAFDKKHGKETTKDKGALTEKLLKEMQSQNNCPVGAAIVNLSLANTKSK
ncbi:MAG: hypothetical protein SGI96_06175 [Bacteroidota bacterium]|nr:hypothetical protein [Bacteroidota bacterium]